MKSVTSKINLKSSASKASPDKEAGDVRKPRSDGVEARERLLHTALRLFAEKGYSKTSTREIAQASGVNIASIKYYFSDKAGLYRAAFSEPMGGPCDHAHLSGQSNLTLRESLEGFFAMFLMPLKQGDLVQLCMRLHFREMLEPTGVWAEEIDNNIKPAHAALVAVLLKHMGVARADDDIHRLAFSIVGLALQIFISRDVIEAIRPKLIATPAAIELWADHLADYAEAMIAVSVAQRAAVISPAMGGISKKKKS
ncbi:CerR family C-terminal domain-containing protein [Herminiimonas fonticola]|uniref:CerR family C-terminal domain-containing protein n=1 Tax=Herminiimonas fonticola TaxID=303380 RepID=UPI00334120A9